jgi:uncharacterized protein with GYD domain
VVISVRVRGKSDDLGGEDNVCVIVDLPEHVTAAAMGIAGSATGLIRTRSTALMTVEEVDRTLEKTVYYRAPGRQ